MELLLEYLAELGREGLGSENKAGPMHRLTLPLPNSF